MKRPHGRASIDPENPEPTALCDKCGFMWNHNRLSWQFDWIGSKLQNKRILVCPECSDEHAMFLKTIIIPPDPPPIYNVRPSGPMSVEGASQFTVYPPPGADMFHASGDMHASMTCVNKPKSILTANTGEFLSISASLTSPNQRIFSISVWFKTDNIGHAPSVFRCEADMSGPNLFRIIQNDDTYNDMSDYTDGSLTQRVRNDSSTGSPGYISLGVWTHMLFSVDTTQAVESDRVKIYKDGALGTSYFSAGCSQNSTFPNFMKNGSLVVLGSDTTSPYRGRLAFIQVIDGAQVNPTDVAQNVSGTWSHKPYESWFGNTGFYFSGDNGMRTKLGVGNSYTFTNSGATMDFSDVPPYVSY